MPKLKILPNTLEKTAQLLKNFPLTPAELEYVVPLTDQTATKSMNGKQSFGFISTIGLKLKLFCRPEHTCRLLKPLRTRYSSSFETLEVRRQEKIAYMDTS